MWPLRIIPCLLLFFLLCHQHKPHLCQPPGIFSWEGTPFAGNKSNISWEKGIEFTPDPKDDTYGVKSFIHLPIPPRPTVPPLPSLEELQRYNNFSAVVYCTDDIEHMNCGLCQYVKKGMVTHKVIYNGFHLFRPPGNAENSVARMKGLDTAALVSVHSDTQEIVVAYRGTYTLLNMFLDFQTRMKTIRGVDEKYMVHKGMLMATGNIYDQVRTEVVAMLKVYPTFKVVITGHSLGGAMASLTVFLFKYFNNFPPEVQFSLFTYGMPRVGNAAYVDYMNNLGIPMARVVNKGDVIAHIFGHGGNAEKEAYIHHLNEYWIQSNTSSRWCSPEKYEDPDCSDSLKEFNVADHETYFGVDYLACFQPDMDLESLFLKHGVKLIGLLF